MFQKRSNRPLQHQLAVPFRVRPRKRITLGMHLLQNDLPRHLRDTGETPPIQLLKDRGLPRSRSSSNDHQVGIRSQHLRQPYND